jgi:S1-C subfamily serine protease
MGTVGYTILVLLVLGTGHAVGHTEDPNVVAAFPQPARIPLPELLPSVLEAVVKIDTDSSSGTGFIVSADGYLVTAAHVISKAKEARVELKNGEKHDAVSVVDTDPRRDIAVLKIKGFKLPTLTLADSDSVQIGTRLILVGNPVLGGIKLDWSVTDGLLSAKRQLDGYTLFQTSVASAPGASGGPVLNEDGKVVAVHVMGIPGEGFKFAVPSNYVAAMLQDIQRLSADAQLARAKSLGALPESSREDIAGTWRVLNSDQTLSLREDAGHIYVSGAVYYPNGVVGQTSYELAKQADGTYSGVILGRWSCQYTNFGDLLVGRVSQMDCPLRREVLLTTVSSTRIEGRVLGQVPPDPDSRAFTKFCKTCGNTVQAEWYGLTWIRVD